MAAVTVCTDLGVQENKVCHWFQFSPIYLPWGDGTGCHDLSFLILSFKPAFSPSSFTLIKRLFSSSSLSAIQFSSVQLLSHDQLFETQWTTACQASLFITNSWSWPKLTSIESVIPPNHLILCHPLLLLPSIFPSIRVFSSESVHIRWPKYQSFSFSISPSNEYSGLISFRVDWLDLFAVQGTLKSLLQDHSSKASICISDVIVLLAIWILACDSSSPAFHMIYSA